MLPSRRPVVVAAALAGIVLPLLLHGCAAPASTRGAPGRLAVVASFYPLEFLVRRVGGDRVAVTGLTPTGTEPHDLALDGPRRAALEDADVAVYLGAGFQPDVADAVRALPTGPDGAVVVDLLDAPGIDLLTAPADLGKESLTGRKDPHVWLSPRRMRAMAAQVVDALGRADPEHQAEYRTRGRVLEADLERLGLDYSTRLTDCAQRTIVTSHAAFGYLAADNRLQQVAIAGISPDDEPDGATLATITRTARAAGVSTVFFEENLPADLAETVAREVGARTSLLAALEFEPDAGQDYLSVMRGNLDRLADGLGCR